MTFSARCTTTCALRAQPVFGYHRAFAVEHFERTVQGHVDEYGLPTQVCGHAVAVAAHVDEGIERHPSGLPVAGIEAHRRQRGKMRAFRFEALAHDLLVGTVHPLVGHLGKPLLEQLVEMRQAFKRPVALKSTAGAVGRPWGETHSVRQALKSPD